MNQTKKRLKIISLAISITDTETIQLQILKLSPLKTDLKIQEIIAGLQTENYAQTQALIAAYIKTPTDDILQRTLQERTLQEKKHLKGMEEKALIEEFDLFVKTLEKQDDEEEIFDFATFKSETPPKKEKKRNTDFNRLLNLEVNDILSKNININIKDKSKDDTSPTEERPVSHNSKPKKEIVESIQNDDEETTEKRSEVTPSAYDAIPYINQKFKNMQTQYPSVEESNEEFPSVKAWLLQINNDGYKNDEVEEMITHVEQLTEKNSLSEAAQLLLISGSTKSKFAQFILARELYKGKILQKNLSESFILINRLALDENYPEAICDLAQFYERGVGTDKNSKKAEALYKEAMELGIKRAIGHYERVKKQNRGFFSAFKK